ncbi:MAG: GNAT family N-acetyltransferase [Candidatus Omnitrophica bacterium]|nr:GNAT family N-acetyltransferase [Candidatus Omnitrophota bacterium]MDD5671198.1 GNAT family N-acetyltransferase [Candidatus Omnitrophota bacterium]
MTPKRIKVFYLITALKIGGAEKLLFETLKCLDRERFEPMVGTLYGFEATGQSKECDLGPEIEKLGIKIVRLGMRHRLDFSVFCRLRKVLLAERPDILHTHLLPADVVGRFVGRCCRVPVVVGTIHAVEAIRTWAWVNWIDKWSARFADRLIASSEKVKEDVLRAERFDAARMQVIPNAIEFEMTDRETIRRTTRASLGIPEGAFLVGIMSRLEGTLKGHEILFDAIRSFKGRYPNLHCAVFGDGAARKMFEKQVRERKLDACVTFAGMQQDVPACLAAMDLFALPSFREGTPLCLIEAMAAGLPIVASRIGGVPDLIEDRKSGLLIPVGDREALARSIEEILEKQSWANELGQAARASFEERFDMRRIIRQTERLYEDLVRQKGRRRIKLLEVVTSFDAGGVTTHLVNLLRHLPREEFEIVVASGREDFQTERFKPLGLPHHFVDLVKAIKPLTDLKALWQLVRFIRRERFDVVHTHMAKADWIAGLAARICGVSGVLSTAHGPTTVSPGPSLMQTIFDMVERITYRKVHHRVISVSQSTTHHLLTKKSVYVEQLSTIANGIECHPEMGSFDRNIKRREWGIRPDQHVLIMVGRLTFPKTPLVLLQSMQRLLQRWPGLVCLIVGDGPDRGRLEAWIRDHHMQESVKLLGHREDVQSLLRLSDIFVLSSDSEGLSMSVLEAMAAGLPVIASRVGGMAELVEHKKTGFLVKPGDAAALANAIGTLLQDASRRGEMSHLSLERVSKEFDCRLQVEKIREVLVRSLDRIHHPVKIPSRLVLRFRQVILFCREEGFLKTLRRLLKFAVTPIYRRERLWFLVRNYHDVGSGIRSKLACTVRRATLEDLDKLPSLYFGSRDKLAALLTSPRDLCFVAEYGGTIVAIQWVIPGLGDGEGFTICPFKYCVKLAEDEAYVHDVRTLKAYRGLGAFAAIEKEIYKWLSSRGYRVVYTDILPDNTISLKTFGKTGFRKFEKVRLTRFLGRVRIHCEHPRLEDDAPVKLLILGSDSGENGRQLSWTRRLSNGSFKTDMLAKPFHGFLFLLWLRLMRERYEIVHCTNLLHYLFGGTLARLAGVRHVTLTLRDSSRTEGREAVFPKKVPAWISRMLRKAELVFFESDTLRLRWLENDWIPEERAERLSENITLASFNGKVTAGDARKKLEIPGPGPVIGTMIPLVDEIYPLRFLDLCRKVKDQIPDSRFIIVGDGPFFRTFKHYVDKAPFADSIYLMRRGYDDRLVLKAMDLFVDMRNASDGSLPMLGAMASAKAVVGMRANGAKGRPVQDACASRIVPQEDVRTIVEILKHPTRLQDLGRANRCEVQEAFEERYRAAQYSVAWNKLLAADLRPLSAAHWRKENASSTFSGKPL